MPSHVPNGLNRMLNLILVRTFVTIAETGSFIEAARRLNLAQSTVSLQLQRLENDLGTMLVRRSHSRCDLTSRGQTVLPYARALLQSAKQLSLAAKGKSITIGCSGNIAAYYISQDLKSFLDFEDRDVAWDTRVNTNPEVADLLASGVIDVAAMEWPPENRNFDVHPWRCEPMVVIVPNQHPLAKSKTISIDQFLALDLIGGESGSGTGTVLKQAFGNRADKLRVTHHMQSTEGVKDAVQSGLGCSIVLAGAVRYDSTRFAVLKLRGAKLEKQFYVATLAGLPEAAVARKFAVFLSSLE